MDHQITTCKSTNGHKPRLRKEVLASDTTVARRIGKRFITLQVCLSTHLVAYYTHGMNIRGDPLYYSVTK